MKKIPELTRSEIERDVLLDDSWQQTTALLSAALYQRDREWVEELCVLFLRSPDPDLQYAAIVSVSHLARLHGKLNLEKVLPLLEAIEKTNSDLAGDIAFTLAEVRIYT